MHQKNLEIPTLMLLQLSCCISYIQTVEENNYIKLETKGDDA